MQNLIVPMKYKHQTRIGNWSEEWELEQTNFKDKNLVQKQSEKDIVKQYSCQRASITYSNDGYLHFGDHIMLANAKTFGYLACNTLESIQDELEAYTVTTSATVQEPITRSIFVIQNYEKEQQIQFLNSNVLHYGQKFLLVVNPRLIKKRNFYLSSLKFQPNKCSKFSRKQLVDINVEDSINNVWVIEHADPKLRFECQNLPVEANAPVVIKHFFTGHWLASDKVIYKNDFGSEFEVFCHSFYTNNKTQNLIAEKTGRITNDETMRNQTDENVWNICTAIQKSDEFDENLLDQSRSVEDVLLKIKGYLSGKGLYGYRTLSKALKVIDEKNAKKVDYDDFKWGLRNGGLTLNNEELQLLYSSFDPNKSNQIDYQQFLTALKGELPIFRKENIQQTYKKLQQACGATVTLEKLVKFFDAKKNPEVVQNLKTEEQAFNEYILNWDTKQADGIISQNEFVNYFEDLSANIGTEDYFLNILNQVC